MLAPFLNERFVNMTIRAVSGSAPRVEQKPCVLVHHDCQRTDNPWAATHSHLAMACNYRCFITVFMNKVKNLMGLFVAEQDHPVVAAVNVIELQAQDAAAVRRLGQLDQRLFGVLNGNQHILVIEGPSACLALR